MVFNPAQDFLSGYKQADAILETQKARERQAALRDVYSRLPEFYDENGNLDPSKLFNEDGATATANEAIKSHVGEDAEFVGWVPGPDDKTSFAKYRRADGTTDVFGDDEGEDAELLEFSNDQDTGRPGRDVMQKLFRLDPQTGMALMQQMAQRRAQERKRNVTADFYASQFEDRGSQFDAAADTGRQQARGLGEVLSADAAEVGQLVDPTSVRNMFSGAVPESGVSDDVVNETPRRSTSGDSPYKAAPTQRTPAKATEITSSMRADLVDRLGEDTTNSLIRAFQNDDVSRQMLEDTLLDHAYTTDGEKREFIEALDILYGSSGSERRRGLERGATPRTQLLAQREGIRERLAELQNGTRNAAPEELPAIRREMRGLSKAAASIDDAIESTPKTSESVRHEWNQKFDLIGGLGTALTETGREILAPMTGENTLAGRTAANAERARARRADTGEAGPPQRVDSIEVEADAPPEEQAPTRELAQPTLSQREAARTAQQIPRVRRMVTQLERRGEVNRAQANKVREYLKAGGDPGPIAEMLESNAPEYSNTTVGDRVFRFVEGQRDPVAVYGAGADSGSSSESDQGLGTAEQSRRFRLSKDVWETVLGKDSPALGSAMAGMRMLRDTGQVPRDFYLNDVAIGQAMNRLVSSRVNADLFWDEYDSKAEVPPEEWAKAFQAAQLGYEDLGEYEEQFVGALTNAADRHGVSGSPSHANRNLTAITSYALRMSGGTSKQGVRNAIRNALAKNPDFVRALYEGNFTEESKQQLAQALLEEHGR